jgi:hypothetical protein
MNLREGFAKALRSRGTISFIERWFDGRVNSKGDFYAWQLCVAHLHAQSFHRGRMPHENAREQGGAELLRGGRANANYERCHG